MQKKPTVLLIEDSESNLKLLIEILQDLYQVKFATNGQDGLDMAIKGVKPDLILLDVIMGGMSGHEVCKVLKNEEATAHIPIIFLTGMTDSDDEAFGLSLGASDYISKPINPEIVKVRVHNLITLKLQKELLERLAMRDALTGLYNRHFLMDAFPKRISRMKRYGFVMSMIMLDLDHFKAVNDNYGHDVGDIVLKKVAEILEEFGREDDIAVRLGGEEFLIILEQCTIGNAKIIAENLRQKIEDSRPHELSITASFGVTSITDNEQSFDSIYKRADAAVYKAKEQGRNRVVVDYRG